MFKSKIENVRKPAKILYDMILYGSFFLSKTQENEVKCFWKSQLMADEWQSVSPTHLLSRNEEALTCGNLMWVLRKTGPTSPKTAFIQLDLPSSSDRPLALSSSAVSESAWRGGIHKENPMQSRLIYFVGSASILFTMLCSPHLAFVIFEPLPSSLFLSVPQVNQEILSLFFVFKIKQNE